MAATPKTTTTRPGLRLQDGEVLLRQGGPIQAMHTQLVVTWSLLALLGVLTAPLALLTPWLATRYLSMHRWWLTDQRLVVRTGLFGWSVRSVPLDRVVDVTVAASWWDLLFGVQHVQVRDMTGEVASSGVSTGLVLMGLADAEPIADALLDAVRASRTARAA